MVKRQVAETWLCNNFGKMETLYMKVLKTLVDVRASTCNDLLLLETGMPSLSVLIHEKRSKYLKNKLASLNPEAPLNLALTLAKSCNTLSTKIIDSALLDHDQNDRLTDRNRLVEKVTSNIESSKRKTYIHLNPNFQTPDMYSDKFVPEITRRAFSRFRLSSHRLRIETGRWSRTPKELRLCPCKCIQDEEHVLLFCPYTRDIRTLFNVNHTSLSSSFYDKTITNLKKLEK